MKSYNESETGNKPTFLFSNFHFFLRYKHQEQELMNLSEGNGLLKEDLKMENKKLQGLKHSKNIDEQEIRFLEEQIGYHERDEEDREQSEMDRRNKVDSLEEKKCNLTSDLENVKAQEDSLEDKQGEIHDELEKQKKSRQDHELKKAKIEANLNQIRSIGKSKLAVFDTLAPKIAARIEEAFRYFCQY